MAADPERRECGPAQQVGRAPPRDEPDELGRSRSADLTVGEGVAGEVQGPDTVPSKDALRIEGTVEEQVTGVARGAGHQGDGDTTLRRDEGLVDEHTTANVQHHEPDRVEAVHVERQRHRGLEGRQGREGPSECGLAVRIGQRRDPIELDRGLGRGHERVSRVAAGRLAEQDGAPVGARARGHDACVAQGPGRALLQHVLIGGTRGCVRRRQAEPGVRAVRARPPRAERPGRRDDARDLQRPRHRAGQSVHRRDHGPGTADDRRGEARAFGPSPQVEHAVGVGEGTPRERQPDVPARDLPVLAPRPPVAAAVVEQVVGPQREAGRPEQAGVELRAHLAGPQVDGREPAVAAGEHRTTGAVPMRATVGDEAVAGRQHHGRREHAARRREAVGRGLERGQTRRFVAVLERGEPEEPVTEAVARIPYGP